MGFIDNLLNAIRNKYLNATGAERDLLTLIKDKDITQAQTLMQNRDTEVLPVSYTHLTLPTNREV